MLSVPADVIIPGTHQESIRVESVEDTCIQMMRIRGPYITWWIVEKLGKAENLQLNE